MLRLTESMAAELKEHRVAVNCVLPGTLDTAANRAGGNDRPLLPPEQVAHVLLFLASEAGRAVTGAADPAYGMA